MPWSVKGDVCESRGMGLLQSSTSPAAPIKPFTERRRHRFLEPEEFSRLFDAIDKLERLLSINIYQAAAIRLLALTGCRLSEILELTWDEVDFRHNRLVLQKHKTDAHGVKGVPLNDDAREILQNLPRKNNTPYVFAGKMPCSHIVNLRKPWLRVLAEAKIKT